MVVAGALQLAVVQHATAAPLPGQFSGASSGLGLFVGASTLASPTLHAAGTGCPCTGTNGVTKTETVSAVALGDAGSLVGAATTTASAVGTNANGSAVSTESAGVTKLSLLGGLITADAVQAEAHVGATAGTLATTDDGTTVVNLVVAGTSVDPATPENTSIALPGLGSVTVKAVETHANAEHASIVVRGLLVTVTEENSFGLAVGSRIAVATAGAGYSRVQPVVYQGGSGAGAEVSGAAGGVVDGASYAEGRIGLKGCSGSGGVTLTRASGQLDIVGLATAATQQATAFGGAVGAAVMTKTTATVTGLSVLGGLVKADTVAAVAQVSRSGTMSTASATGSAVTGLTVAGLPVAVSTPNLKITLPGIGYVVANEQTPSGSMRGQIDVTGLDVVVTQANTLGVPAGARVQLARAVATARRY